MPLPYSGVFFRLLLCTIFVQGCTMDYDQLADDRVQYSKKNKGNIVIVAIEDPEKTEYIQGVQLAVQQVNQRYGKLLGRKLELLIEKGAQDFETVLPVIQKIAANPKVTAVVGHRTSKIAVPASVIYEKSKIVFLPSFATAKGLTNHGFSFVFRMAPNNLVMAEQMASMSKILGYQNIVSLYAHDSDSREFAFSFEDAALKLGINFVFRSAFSADNENYRPLITRFKNHPVDAVFISAMTQPSMRMIKQLRSMGIKAPILGGDRINPRLFSKLMGEEGDNTIIPTQYRRQNKTNINQQFRALYQKTYQTDADDHAAQGYDSIMLVVAAIERAQSTMPTSLSSALHYIPFWQGVSGVLGFNDQGELLGKHYYFKLFKRGKWKMIPGIHIPYTLDKFTRDIAHIRGEQDITPFKKSFSHRLHLIDFKKLNLDLMHEILQFQTLGWIYDESHEDLAAEKIILQYLANKKGFTLVECGIPFIRLTQQESQQRLIECYGTLAPSVQALYLSVSENMEQSFIKRLNYSLQAFEVPVFAYQANDAPLNMGLSLTFERTDIQLNNPKAIDTFSGILNKIKAFELVDRLADMPYISANLGLLNQFGFLASKEILSLSPHPPRMKNEQ